MKREGWARWSLPNPSSCAFPLGSLCADRLREEKEAPGLSRIFNSTVLAWWWISIYWEGRSKQGLFSFWPTSVGNSPRNYGWECISWLSGIWGYTFKGEVVPLQWTHERNCESHLTVCGAVYKEKLISPILESEIFPVSQNALSNLLTKNVCKIDL